MKVKFVLYGESKYRGHDDHCINTPIYCDWKYPFLPRIGEEINMHDMFPEGHKKIGLEEKRFFVMDIEWRKDYLEIWCKGNF